MEQEINVFDKQVVRGAAPAFVDEVEREKLSAKQGKKIIEGLLFAAPSPVSFDRIRAILDAYFIVRPKEIRQWIAELKKEYDKEERAFQLYEAKEGYVLRTKRELGEYIDHLLSNKREDRLSVASTEVLAIIAYRQPITRVQVDKLRGVDSSGAVYNLLERELIESAGRAEGPGRPTLYRVTRKFMDHFGLESLDELPDLPE